MILCVVLSKLQQDIQKAKYFDTVLNKTLEVSVKEQISICFRITSDNLGVQEVFCGFYKTMSTTSEKLFKIVINALFRFQFVIDKCRGQCYDGNANVFGHVNGLFKKLIQEESRAIYFHRRAHNKINLVV